jgi:hypothetical protein
MQGDLGGQHVDGQGLVGVGGQHGRGDCELAPEPGPQPGQLTLPELAGWAQLPAARIPVARRALATYDLVGGLA